MNKILRNKTKVKIATFFVAVLSIFSFLYLTNSFDVQAQSKSLLKKLSLARNESGEVLCDGQIKFDFNPLTPNLLKVRCDQSSSSANGLTAKYFNNKNFTDLMVTRVDSTVNFDWKTGKPTDIVSANTFSVEWSGKIKIPTSGEYTFYTYSDDGIRLYVNNQKVIENWTDHSPTENAGRITLNEGEYPIYIQYYENTGQAVAKLYWSANGISKQIVPSTNLIPDGASNGGVSETPSTTPSVSPTVSPTVSATPKPSTSPSPTSAPSATPNPGSIPQGGLGVGTDGREVGINLARFNDLKARAAQGEFDRPCNASEHDNTKWHTLVNEQAKCHYDHHHGDDPNYVNDIFGEPGNWFAKSGQSVSYPWQTFSLPADMKQAEALRQTGTEGQKENDLKHEGYYWVVRRNQPCDADGYCIKDFRIQYHFHGTMDAPVRFHSMSAEVRACRDVNDLSTCGIVRTGGWMDHGQLITPASNTDCWEQRQDNRNVVLPLLVDRQFFDPELPELGGDLIDEFRCHKPLNSTEISRNPSTTGGRAPAEWWAHGASDFRFQLLVFDPISNVTKNTDGSVNTTNFHCGMNQTNCRWNQSVATLRVAYILPVNSYYVQGGYVQNGKAMLPLGKRYLNRFGGINNSCTQPGLDCIPLEYNNLPLSVDPGRGLAGFNHVSCENNSCPRVDHDITPADRPSWITWFHKHAH